MPSTRPQPDRQEKSAAAREAKQAGALHLWNKSGEIEGTPAETYLRQERGYAGPIPATIGFLPAHGKHPAALISAFTLPSEPEPHMLSVDANAVDGVHLVSLTNDGRKASVKPVKRMVGRCLGTPIVLSPLNDLLGLVICEGVETGLSLLEATGCGVWAAGSASFMPALADAVPDHVDCVTVAGEPDDGLKHAVALTNRLKGRGLTAQLADLSATPEARAA